MPQKRILAVEDDDLFAGYLETVLAKMGYLVLPTAATGEDGVARAKAHRPDLVLMDIKLAGAMDGIEAARHIQSFCDIPIVYLTGHSDGPFLSDAKITMPYGYLVKPVTQQELAATMEMALYRHGLDMKLKESESRLALALAAAHMGVWEWAVETNEIFWSPECHSIFQVEDFAGTFESFTSLLHPDDAPILMTTFSQASSDSPSFQTELRFKRPDGETRWLTNSGRCYFDETGRLVRVIGTVQDITERKTAEERLLIANFALESSISAIGFTDLQGRATFVNDSFVKLWGYESAEEIVGRQISEFAMFGTKGEGIEAARAGLGYVGEGLGRKKDGSPFPIQVVGNMVRTSAGEPLCMMGSFTDIAERKKAEEALRESEERYRVAIESSNDAVMLLRGDTLIFANQQFFAMSGYAKEEIIGRPLFPLVHPDDRERIAGYLDKSATGKETPRRFEFRGITKGGMIQQIEASVSRFNYRGEPVGLAFFRDVTERKKAESEIRLLKHSIDVYYDGAYWMNTDNRFIYVNDAACRSLGYEREELIGMTIDQAIPAVTAEQMERLWEEFRKGGSFLGESVGRRKDGSEFPVDIVATYVDFGGQEYACGFARDISERKKLEEQLRQAQKMEAVGALAGGVAHDFNNILSVIMGLGNLLQMCIDKDDANRPYIDQIVASSERAADLVQSLLAFSRKQRITVRRHGVNDVVTSTAKLLTRLLPEDIELRLILTDENDSSLLDVAQIGQVLMNLATNARDAMPHGGILSIATRRARIGKDFIKTHGFGKAGEYVRLSVSDTGIGMERQTLEHIFEPFFTTKEVGKGTGLGLASAYGVVKQHKGYITVSSLPLKGTAFDIYLPFLDSHPLREAPARAETAKGRETILVIEDDRDVRYMVAGILESHGYRTIGAVDGDDAIRVYHNHRDGIGLIILDVVMPGKNGKEVFDEIAGFDPGVKAIFMSGYTGDIVIGKGVLEERMDFLQKPLSAAKLLEKVREVLDRKPATTDVGGS